MNTICECGITVKGLFPELDVKTKVCHENIGINPVYVRKRKAQITDYHEICYGIPKGLRYHIHT